MIARKEFSPVQIKLLTKKKTDRNIQAWKANRNGSSTVECCEEKKN